MNTNQYRQQGDVKTGLIMVPMSDYAVVHSIDSAMHEVWSSAYEFDRRCQVWAHLTQKGLFGATIKQCRRAWAHGLRCSTAILGGPAITTCSP